MQNDLVFVIMSFSPDMEPVFEGIGAAAQTAGFQAKRVKDIVGDYRITSRIIELITTSCMVVVDLTHERPNVYFELGYARGLERRLLRRLAKARRFILTLRTGLAHFIRILEY